MAPCRRTTATWGMAMANRSRSSASMRRQGSEHDSSSTGLRENTDNMVEGTDRCVGLGRMRPSVRIATIGVIRIGGIREQGTVSGQMYGRSNHEPGQHAGSAGGGTVESAIALLEPVLRAP